MSEKRVGRPRTIDPEAVSLAALRLFDTAGYDAVSMDDISAATGVSRRYLFRLFPSKAALLWGGLDEFMARLLTALDSCPRSMTALSALELAYREAAAFPEESVEITRHRLRVIAANPGLMSGQTSRVLETAEHIRDVISKRDGFDTGDLAPAVMADALAAAASSALTWWALNSTERPEDVVARGIQIITRA